MNTNINQDQKSDQKEKVIIAKGENDELLAVEIDEKKKTKLSKLKEIIDEGGTLNPEAKLLSIKFDGDKKEKNLYKIFMESFSSQYGLKSYLNDRISADKLKNFLSSSKSFFAVDKEDLAKVASGEMVLKRQFDSFKISDEYSLSKLPGTKANEAYSLTFANEETGLFNNLQFKDVAAFKDAVVNNEALRKTLENPSTNWMLIRIDEQKLNSIKISTTDLKEQHSRIFDQGEAVAFKVGEKVHTVSMSKARALGQAFTEEDIDWKQLESMGINRGSLKEQDLKNLLEGKKTGIIPFSIMKGDVKQLGEAKFRLAEDQSGRTSLVVHGVRKALSLPEEIAGYKLTEGDKKALQNYGTTFSKVELSKNGKKYPAYLGVDKDTNELVVLPANKIRINETLKGVKLTAEQRDLLQQGKSVFIENMKGEKVQQFSAYVAIDPAKSTLQFFKSEPKLQITEKEEVQEIKKRGPKIS